MLVWDITRWRRIFLINDGGAERKTKSRNRTSNFESTADTCTSAPVSRLIYREMSMSGTLLVYPKRMAVGVKPRRLFFYIVPSECDDCAFCKVCDDSFFVAYGSGNYEFM